MIHPAPTKEQWEKLHPNVLSNNFMTSRNANQTENATGEKTRREPPILQGDDALDPENYFRAEKDNNMFATSMLFPHIKFTKKGIEQKNRTMPFIKNENYLWMRPEPSPPASLLTSSSETML